MNVLDIYQINDRVQVLNAIQQTRKPESYHIWKDWRSWLEMDESLRSFWPAWRQNIFEDIALNEDKFRSWYVRQGKDDSYDPVNFFQVVCDYFFDLAYEIKPSPSLKANLFRLGIHSRKMGDCLRYEKFMRGMLTSVKNKDVIAYVLPISFVYKRMSEYG